MENSRTLVIYDLLDIRVVPEPEDQQDTNTDQALERHAQTHADGGEQEHKRRQHIERTPPVAPRIHTYPQQILHQVHAVEQSINSLPKTTHFDNYIVITLPYRYCTYFK